jgi:hypothetical protein
MDIIEICPSCGSLGIEVEPITVKSMLKEDLKPEFKDNVQWFICSMEKLKIFPVAKLCFS